MNCPCGTSQNYSDCCEPFHLGEQDAPTPEALMRSRYTAFALKKTDYLEDTTDPQTRQNFDFRANEKWANEAEFLKLEIISSSEDGNKGFVEFKATFQSGGQEHVHHEKSRFRKQAGQWFFREGKTI